MKSPSPHTPNEHAADNATDTVPAEVGAPSGLAGGSPFGGPAPAARLASGMFGDDPPNEDNLGSWTPPSALGDDGEEGEGPRFLPAAADAAVDHLGGVGWGGFSLLGGAPDWAGAPDTIGVGDGEGAAKGGSPGKPGGGGGGGGGGGDGVLSYYASGRDKGLYNIEIQFSGTWTSALQTAFINAVTVLESIVHDDAPDVYVRQGRTLTLVDDIVIKAELKAIDGVYGILGQAGPTTARTGSYLPATATMQFDSADADWMQSNGSWGSVIIHEMMHCLGFGTLWGYKGLVNSAGLFTGAGAIAEYAELLGVDPSTVAGVPVEQDGGSGTAGGHWDEQTFYNELMTGWLNSSTVNPLSAMSAASLGDFGYGLAAESSWMVGAYSMPA